MTAHPIDTEALRRDMEYLAGDALARDDRWEGTVSPVEALAILDLLAAAEHRATRAEARIKAVQALIDQADEAGVWTVTSSRLQWAIDGEVV